MLTAFFLPLCAGCAQVGQTVEITRVLRATGVAYLAAAPREMGLLPPEAAVVAEGKGVGFPAASATTSGQKRLTALAAARYRALADVAETLHGTHLTKESRVADMAFAGEEIEAKVSGILPQAQVVDSRYDEDAEIAEVTVKVVLDSEGNAIPLRSPTIWALSIAAQRAQTEMAAREDAVAGLRRQLGELEVAPGVRADDIMRVNQRAQLLVEGMLEGVRLGKPRWPKSERCVVEAQLALSPADLERLRAVARPAETREEN